MKRLLLLLVLITSLADTVSAQNWLWGKASTTSVSSTGAEGYGVSADAFGNVYATGYFDGPDITFGTYTLTNTDPTFHTSDIYIVKYDGSGNVVWAKSEGGAASEEAFSVSTDASGNVYVTGYFYSPTITFGTFTLTNSGSADIFTVKYNSAGTVLWAASAGGSNFDASNSVSGDASGNAYVTGTFLGTAITVGTFTLTNTDPSGNTENIFIAKYDPSGNVVWAASPDGNHRDYGNSICADASGNVYVTGYFDSPAITFGTFTLTNTVAYFGDIFIAKYDGSGNVIWAKSAGGNNIDIAKSVSADALGNTYVAGYFRSPTIAFSPTTLTNAGSNDIFIIKYDVSGNVIWAESAGGSNQDLGFSVSAEASGNVYLTGNFNSSSITFGLNNLTPPPATCAGGCDPIFIAKYDSNGNVLCSSALASGGDDQFGVSADNAGNAYVSSDFMANPFTVGPSTLALTGTENVYVAKYVCACNTFTINTTQNNASCGNNNGSITITSVTGAPSPYTYSWYPTGGTNATATGLSAGNYTITVTAGGCVGTTTVAITVAGSPTVSLSSQANILCHGGNGGTAAITVNGGLTPYTYAWSSGGGTTSAATGLSAGNYSVVVTDANGCSQNQVITIMEPAALTTTVTSIPVCGNNNGMATIMANGGTGNYTYLWNPSAASTATISGLSSGTYSCTLTDANGCIATTTANVIVNPNPIASAYSDITITQGQSATLAASGGGAYLWSSGSIDSITSVSPSATTIYCVTVTNANNCTDSACVTVEVEPLDCSGDLYLPNAFSPNNDNQNDSLQVYYKNILCIKSFHIIIYDRWGENIFESTDPSFQWDGIYEGKILNTQVLAYSLSVTFISQPAIEKKGNVSLIR
jgi:gliding motility-associated-like protein